MRNGKWGAAAMVLAACTLVMLDWAQGWKMAAMVPEALDRRPVLTLWYTDEGMEDYLTKAAYEYAQEYDVRITPVYKSGLEYLEAVNTASVSALTDAGNGTSDENGEDRSAENMPDLYIVSNDALEKAALAGLAVPADQLDTEAYCLTAQQAVTYHEQAMAYPFYFETTALVYNKDYVNHAAEQMDGSPDSLLPVTINDILNFADNYEAPEAVEAVFKWDVSDIFYNYFFAGDEINVGGSCGDDAGSINIFNEKAVSGLKAYQTLNQFFSIDAKASSYDAVLQDFLDGKTVFTVATSDVLQRIMTARKEGSSSVNYGVTALPKINDAIESRSLSVTNAVAVNGYSEKQELANAFASWLTTDGAADLFAYTGHIPACRECVPEVEGAAVYYQEYEDSIPVPKLMCTANFWVQMEIAYTKIWSGEDVEEILKQLSEQMESQTCAQTNTN